MDEKPPLLTTDKTNLNLKGGNSINNLKCDFLSNLPEKVKTGFDPETPFVLDFSKTIGLAQGEKEYYERQFATLKSFEEVDSLDSHNVVDEEADIQEQAQHEKAMNISNWGNVFLLAFKIYATVQSGSLAIAASTLDSLLDLVAGGILYFTNLSMKSINIYKYPIGKLRVQPVGIIIFVAIMATLDEFKTTVLVVRNYAHSDRRKTRALGLLQKFWKQDRSCLCKAAILVDTFYWWIDPAGAKALAVYTIMNWSRTMLENAGQTAPPEVLQNLTYLVLRHDTKIKHVDTVDIELPEDLPLKEAHTIGKFLQIKIEELSEVERAFVHLDYECDHKSEHTILSNLNIQFLVVSIWDTKHTILSSFYLGVY
ncbi:hypothetical protein BUALT_Bualt08G0111200 [Buddleja alternifolia]|uniref:Cation efflux protein transmembrane domain-containing protein n=1 Tax=Buddleja alternifolia TaxID=168488 RepID=A0AAV6XCI6_9LAMI|nr:hypothetical protein BUALT_Bualt08G0111200 [Buddleja alternifolia]